jgi:RNA polymerase sigma-70 factor (ECF subfamily)
MPADSKARTAPGSILAKLVPLSQRTDEELMAMWVESRRRGRPDNPAFATLYDRHKRTTMARLRAVLRQRPELAEDLFQETWAEVAAVDEWQSRNFKAWVHLVATRKAFDRMARHDLRKTHITESSDDEENSLFFAIKSEGVDPETAAIARAGVRTVLDVVTQLPAEQRDAWTLRYVEGAKFDEIARQQGVPLGTAKGRVRLALVAIAEALPDLAADRKIEEAS